MFQDSAFKEVKRYRFYEEGTALPVNAFPAYIGSGNCILSVDAMGMQGINNRVQEMYGGTMHGADMYVVGHGILAKGINRFFMECWGEDINTLPFGWLDYVVTIDGKTYDTAAMEQYGAVYRRDINIQRAEVTTCYILDSKIELEIKAFVPYGTMAPVFAFRTRSYCNECHIADEEHQIRIETRLHTTVRDGTPLFDEVSFDGNLVHTRKAGYKLYELQYRLSNSQGSPVRYNDNCAAMEMSFVTGNERSQWQYTMFSFDANNDVSEVDALYQHHLQEWKTYYNRLAQIETGIVEEEWMYNHSLYLYHMAYCMDYGVSIGHPFCFPGCWQACSFWDSVYVMDALTRIGDRSSADKLLKFYKSVMRKEGKPFPWMMIYDGHTFIDPKKDNAPLVVAAIAMIAIRHYECYHDRELLKTHVYPIVSRCAEYAVEEMFTQDENGRYYVSLPVSNDVVDEEGEEVNQTFTTLWFAVVLEKAYQYGHLLDEANCIFHEIAQNVYLEHTDEEYLHCRGHKAEDWKWASWLPFMLYPTEGKPFVDMGLLEKTFEKYTYTDLYMEKQNCWQPWSECIEAQSRIRAGMVEEGYWLIRQALKHTFGCGYFSEIGPHQQTVAFPPYISAHSSFVAAYVDQFIDVSIWNKNCRLFYMTETYANRRVELQNIQCAGNIRLVHAIYRSDSLKVQLEGELSGLEVDIHLPPGMDLDIAKVYANGREINFKRTLRKRTIHFVLDDIRAAEIEVI